MIIARSPLRIPLGGGGTDLPSYYNIKNGYVVSAAINKYIYVSLAETFNKYYILNYSKSEHVKKISEIKHPLFREILKYFKTKTPIHLASHADIPSGTGLGSSGCFTVTLANVMSKFHKYNFNNKKLAEIACNIEINKLKEPVGKQDQYVASFGGINEYHFYKKNNTRVRKLKLSNKIIKKLENNLILFFTGYTRSSYKILNIQDKKTKNMDKKMIENLDKIKSLGFLTTKALLEGNLDDFYEIMKEHWHLKKNRSSNISNSKIDYFYDLAIKNGAKAGKLIGAGGGGFLLFYSKDKKRLNFLEKKGLKKIDFNFDFSGSKIIT